MPQSPFDVSDGNRTMDEKIVLALERISEAFRVLLWNQGKSLGLSPIQVQVLIFMRYHPSERRKVSQLAKEFNMTQATISDSVRVLIQKGLLEKLEDSSDHRSFVLGLSPSGEKAAQTASDFTAVMVRALGTQSEEAQAAMLGGLLRFIQQLNREGVITPQRMCLNCKHFRSSDGIHSCQLLQSNLSNQELRVDCPEHESRELG